jgi:surfactin synthase thioesterase subunit
MDPRIDCVLTNFTRIFGLTNRMTDWLAPRQRNERTKYELYCFPHAGGGSALYHRWERKLGEQLLVFPIKLPGRESRLQHPAIDSLSEMLLSLEEEVQPLVTPPFALFGHSMGGLLAYEWTVALAEQGLKPSLLVVSASRSPDCYTGKQRIHELPDDEMIATLQRDFNRGAPPSDEEMQMMCLMADTIRADMKLLETYRWPNHDPLDVPILALYGTQDDQIKSIDMEGWAAMTAN